MDSGEFDPRFDPAFQPGFDPEKHRSGPRRLFGSSASTVSESTGASASNPQLGTVANVGQLASAHVGQPQAGPDSSAHASPDSVGDGELHSVPMGQNPFVRALWFVSAGLMVGGLLLYWWGSSDIGGSGWDGSSPTFLMILQQSTWVLVPAMVTVGLAGLVGLLFLYASRWRPGGAVDEASHDGEPSVGLHGEKRHSSPEQPGLPAMGGPS